VLELREVTGLEYLSLLFRCRRVAIDPARVRHRLGGEAIGLAEMLRCAKEFNFKARLTAADRPRLAKLSFPAAAECRDGGFPIVTRPGDDNTVVQVGGRPLTSASEFQAFCSGHFVLPTWRASIRDLRCRLDISWFLLAVQKYRRLLSEVLVASLFLQRLDLITPLYFRVATDKVLVRLGSATREILMVGLIAVSIFDKVSGALCTFVSSHSADRINVELNARLLQHLMALPIAYFDTRRGRDAVARVRELENVRNFFRAARLYVQM
jgi:ATP-binding cassette, subfamily B, bacterial HlyB/CyaB